MPTPKRREFSQLVLKIDRCECAVCRWQRQQENARASREPFDEFNAGVPSRGDQSRGRPDEETK